MSPLLTEATISVIPFPGLDLTEKDEAAILATARSGGYYCCLRGTSHQGQPSITLLDRKQSVRGHITKRAGVYTVADARGRVVEESRSLEVVLSVLSK